MKNADPSTASDHEELRRRAQRAGLPFAEFVTDDMLDPALLAQVPVEWARANALLPVRSGGQVRVLTAEVDPSAACDDLGLLMGGPLEPVIAPRGVIMEAIERCYFRKTDTPEQFMQDSMQGDGGAARVRSRADDILQVAREAPVIQLVNLILLEAVRKGASDVHVEPFEDRLRVRYRIDGVLYEQASPPKSVEESLISRVKVMARMDIAEKRLPQDGMARVRVGEREIDIRVSTVPVAEGERLVLRLLNQANVLLPLGDLGMAGDILDSFERMLSSPNGMLVVAGPTGSGKTTTLYAALGRMDAVRRNILTIEEPIEYQLPNIGQIQVKPKIGLSFAVGLRHILRQDPDIVLVGEVRDLETAEIAVRASLTGHLVFTTLHTNDAPGAVTRLVDMGVEPYLLASCLRAALSQRLVRRLCACRRMEPLTPAEREQAGELAALVGEGVPVGRPVGCAACMEGFKGRVGLFELLAMDRRMQESVRLGHAGVETLRSAAAAAGMKSLMDDGITKVLGGVTSLGEVLGATAT
jgi:general secretion pathway protein E